MDKAEPSVQMLWTSLMCTVFFTACTCHAQPQNLKLVVNGEFRNVSMKHFWKSTGFCPPLPHEEAAEFDLGADMAQNVAYLGAVPHGGIRQVRIHWLLDLVTVQRFSSGWPVYNFTFLDQMVDLLHKNGLRPGFELMGNPSNIFTDMENKTQLHWWRDLTMHTAVRYINYYGLDYVKRWNFETWNEPDCHDFDKLKMTIQGFLHYYDACSEGLKAASPSLVFGGPGDGCDQTLKRGSQVGGSSMYREALLHHVVNGTNYFTGERGVRLDFISLHRKGNGKAINIINDELESMSQIGEQFPQLANTPFYNDEADPLVGWSKDEHWRATAAYAAMVVKVVCQHQNILLASGHSPINYTLLSNDNGFLSFYPHQFTQRTLLARFQMNETGDASNSSWVHARKNWEKGGTKARSWQTGKEKYVTFIRKPIYAAMVLLSKLGDHQVFSELLDQKTGESLPNASYAGCLATMYSPASYDASSDSRQWAVVVYSSSDTSPPTRWGTLDTHWRIPAINATDLMLAVYTIGNKVTNPYFWWHDVFHKPDFPTLKQFEQIRKNEGPYRHSLIPVSSDEAGVVGIPQVELEEPQVVLFHLCRKSPSPPEQVIGLRLVNITAGQVLIVWSDVNIRTKCIKTFEVEQRKEESRKFIRINAQDSIVNLFVHATGEESQVAGEYRVRAVDYWQRAGPYCSTVPYPTS